MEINDKDVAIKVIRAFLESNGHDTTDFTDEEIEEASLNFGIAVSRAGISTEEAAAGAERLAKAFSAIK